MPKMIGDGLSRREREILDVLHRREQATVADVLGDLPSAPSYSSVRSLLRILEEKGHVRHLEEGRRYIYLPTEPRKRAAGFALRQVIETFFGGSIEQAVTAFLSDTDTQISEEDIERLSEAVAAARERDMSNESEKD